MADYRDLARRLETALQLQTAPVAVSFSATLPKDVPSPDAPVAAGCEFWQIGTERAVATTASDHQFCSIGIHTHALADAPPNQKHELETTLAAMQGLDYVRPEEVAELPVMPTLSKSVTYAPLATIEHAAVPAVVLVFANAAQGLVIVEALSRVDGGVPAAMGRPACAVIPQIVNSERSTASLGCCGARVYVKALADEVTMWGLVGTKLEAYVDAIDTLAKGNDTLHQFHLQRRAEINAGGAPSVADSLARLA